MQRIIFVVGNSRSGTTMMGRILGGHGDVFTFNELHFFEQLWNPASDAEELNTQEALDLVSVLISFQRAGYYAKLKPWNFRDDAREVLAGTAEPYAPHALYRMFMAYETARHHKTVACDQTPRNLYYIEELLELYPEARFVVMVRDPRDVLLSQKNRWKRRRLGAKGTPWWNALRTWAGYHPITISMLWRSGIAAGDRFKDNARVCVLRFEDLLEDPKPQLKRVCEVTGLTFNANMLDVPRVGSSHEQDRPNEKGLDPKAAGRWRDGGLTDVELEVCQGLTAEYMGRHSYNYKQTDASIIGVCLCKASWVFKSALALALNFRRIKSLRESIGRRLRQ